MQNAKQTGFQGSGERLESLESSGSSLGTHEDLSTWGGKGGKIPGNRMASAQNTSSGVHNDRISSVTVFDDFAGGEGLVETRKQPVLGGVAPNPPLMERALSPRATGSSGKAPIPAPPPDMDNIE